MDKISWLILAALLFSVVHVTSAEATGPQATDRIPVFDLSSIKTLPKAPILTQGCEGECCGILKTHHVLANIQLFAAPSVSAKKVATLKKGDAFEDATFFTKISRFGKVTEHGKKLTVVAYQSEGSLLVWDGKKLRSLVSDSGFQSPHTESWVRVKTKAGLIGWANLPSKEGEALDYGWCG